MDQETVPKKEPRKTKSKRNSPLAFASVSKIAHIKGTNMMVEKKAIQILMNLAEQYIEEICKGSVPFMEHRGGTMLKERDIQAYLHSLTKP